MYGNGPKGAKVLNIHLKESGKNGPIFAELVRIADEERRTLAGMAWVLLLDGMKARQDRLETWRGLAEPAKDGRR